MNGSAIGALFLSALCLVVTIPAISDQNTFSLKVDVLGGEPNRGAMILSLFSSKESFLKQPMVSQTSEVDDTGRASFRVPDLLPGRYAVSAFYDEDRNGELTTGLLGIPKELVGFSNNVKGVFGPPKFEKAAFDLHSTMEITISLGRVE